MRGSVKHGYRSLSTVNDSNGSISWRSIWSLKLPPAVRNFLWRSMHNILPVLTVLAAHRVAVEVLCPLCRDQPETLDHLMKGCVDVVPIW